MYKKHLLSYVVRLGCVSACVALSACGGASHQDDDPSTQPPADLSMAPVWQNTLATAPLNTTGYTAKTLYDYTNNRDGDPAWVDLNGDGVKDLLPAIQYTSPLIWLQRVPGAEREFQPHTIAPPAYRSTILAVDMNGDGALDIVTQTLRGDITWYENQGGEHPEFVAHALSDWFPNTLSGEMAPIELTSSDLDHNGQLELLFAMSTSSEEMGSQIIRLQTGANPVVEPVLTTVGYAQQLLAADMDSDGDRDLLVSERIRTDQQLERAVAWYENHGTSPPSFTRHRLYIEPKPPSESVRLQADDIDGDGDLDVLLEYSSTQAPLWVENNLQAKTGTVHPIISGAHSEHEEPLRGRIQIKDLDNDGDLDLIARQNDQVRWYEFDNAEQANFTRHNLTPELTDSSVLYDVEVLDVDKDGDIDLMYSVKLNSTDRQDVVFLLENLGSTPTQFSQAELARLPAGDGRFLFHQITKQQPLVAASGGDAAPSVSFIRPPVRQLQVPAGQSLQWTESAHSPTGHALTYAIRLGPDAGLREHLSIDAQTGTLTFRDAPPVNQPLDANGDNTYEFRLSVSDGHHTRHRDASITVYQDDQDDDNDGTPDNLDAFPLNPNAYADYDGDGLSDQADPDNDNDGALNQNDYAPYNAQNTSPPLWYHAWENRAHTVGRYVKNIGDLQVLDLDQNHTPDLVVGIGGFRASPNLRVWSNTGEQPLDFEAPEMSGSEPGLQALLRTDLDVDGDWDLLAVQTMPENRSSIAWYENTGGGAQALNEQILIADLPNPVALEVADLDGDGDQDVVYSTGGDEQLLWLENQGDLMHFTVHTLERHSGFIPQIRAVDFDGDGDMDVLANLRSERSLGFYENLRLNNDSDDSSSATTSAPQFKRHILPMPLELNTFELADLDADSDLDIVVRDGPAPYANKVLWLENRGPRHPAFVQHLIMEDTSGDILQVQDMDSDGDPDLLFTNNRENTLVYMENGGSPHPTFYPHRRAMERAMTALAVADINHDGIAEVVVAVDEEIQWLTTPETQVHVLEGQGLTMPLNAEDSDGNPLTYRISHGPDAALFKVDGQPDRLTMDIAPSTALPQDANGDNEYLLWLAASDGDFTSLQRLRIIVLTDDEDDDNDGVDDLLDAFPLDRHESEDTDGDGLGNNADEDDDNDGVTDALDHAPLDATSTRAPEWENPADDNNAVHTVLEEQRGYPSFHTTDLDQDGDLDLVAHTSELTLSWLQNNGAYPPQFSEHDIQSSSFNESELHTADLDGDGDLDILKFIKTSERLHWYENLDNNSLNFTERTLGYAGEGWGQVLATADLDDDGDIDVLTGTGDKGLFWFENHGGAQRFSRHALFHVQGDFQAIEPVDVDGDGDLDFYTVADDKSLIAWHENKGPAAAESVDASPIQFRQRVISAGDSGELSAASGDLDRDGDPDLVVIDAKAGTAHWYENTRDPQRPFIRHVFSAQYDQYSGPVRLVDMDGDGDLDVVGKRNGQGLTFKSLWFENIDGAASAFQTHWIGYDSYFSENEVGDIDGDGVLEIIAQRRAAPAFVYTSIEDRNITVAAGERFIAMETAWDGDGNTLTYSILGGPDADWVTIQAATGELSFKQPASATHQDYNGDNHYQFWIAVTDGSASIHRLIDVEVAQ